MKRKLDAGNLDITAEDVLKELSFYPPESDCFLYQPCFEDSMRKDVKSGAVSKQALDFPSEPIHQMTN